MRTVGAARPSRTSPRRPGSPWAPSPTCSTVPSGSAPRPGPGSSRRWPTSASCATSRPASCGPGTQPHPRLRDARRDQPVLHRRRPGHRGRRRGRRPLAVPLQQRQPRRPRGHATSTGSQQQRVQGILVTPGRPRRRPRSTTWPCARHPGRDRRPDPARADALLGVGRRRARRPAGRRAPRRPRPPADRLRRRPDSLGQVRDRLRGRAPGLGARPGCPRTTWSS